MKKVVILGMALIMTGVFGLAWAEPLAPLAKLDDYLGMLLSPAEREVPDASKVRMPAYPGSLVCSVMTKTWGEKGWSEAMLISEAPYEKVSAWYRQKMKGWYCKEWSKGMVLSCSDKDPGPAGYEPLTSNVVEVLNVNIAIPCVMPDMKTGINLRFQPD